MGKLLPFPTACDNHKLETTPNKSDYLIIKTFNYTCPNCKTKSTFNQENMIFKRIHFYCGGCGQPHVVINPALKEK